MSVLTREQVRPRRLVDNLALIGVFYKRRHYHYRESANFPDTLTTGNRRREWESAVSILSDKQRAALLKAGKEADKAEAAGKRCHLPPVVLLRLPNSPPAAWMLAYVTPGDPDLAFGLMDLGEGFPELGFVRLSELESLRGYRGKGVSHDPIFKDASKLDISEYARIADDYGKITLRFDAKVNVAAIMQEMKEEKVERKKRAAKKKNAKTVKKKTKTAKKK